MANRLLAGARIMLVSTACGSIAPLPDAGIDASVDASMDASDADDEAACAAPCPVDRPEAGTPCSTERECEYPRTDAACPGVFSCELGKWIGSAEALCPNDAGACGASLAATEGTPCNKDSRCDFDGATCICWVDKFVCDHPTAACPVPRPMAGSSCPVNDVVCTESEYVDLRSCDFTLACRHCAWRFEPTHTCP